jgi:hypothetical protein
VFECFNVPNTFWPPIRGWQRQLRLDLAEWNFQG